MNKAEEYMGKEWLEYISKATGESIETLKNVKCLTMEDYKSPNPSDSIQYLVSLIHDMLCVAMKAFSEKLGAEEAKKIVSEAWYNYAYTETKKALKKMGKEDEHSIEFLAQMGCQYPAATESKEIFFFVSDKMAIATNGNCPSPDKFKEHGINDPEYCKVFGSGQLGMAHAINPKIEIEIAACRNKVFEPDDPYCVYIYRDKS